VKKLNALLPLLLLPALFLSQQPQDCRPGPLVFTHVTVIDMTGAPAKPDMTLVITDDQMDEGLDVLESALQAVYEKKAAIAQPV